MANYIWTRPEDKNPNETGTYLVTVNWHDLYDDQDPETDICMYSFVVTEADFSTVYGWISKAKVYAWMPMPEPYDPEEIFYDYDEEYYKKYKPFTDKEE